MGRHTPLTDAQRAAAADRAVEQVAATLGEVDDGSTRLRRQNPLSDDGIGERRT
ncbi:hypothetical protein SAMN05443574_10162 [Haloarcula vallismortis]|uniref:Uncharacterized protein n=1 Tax=Haloarcula vallismortis TaxID=28442 RepID=A0A1H2Q4Y2_HALVA|nr:hypothetical protein [Haloarcula vallismortis]SDW02120.1 hypothetical protein SAMN05443574_10162 [Haloarcula vallismortis]